MRKTIETKDAPTPIGPYSQGVIANGILYSSGQIAIHPDSGELLTNTIKEETHQVMKNIEALLKQAELTFDNVLKCSIFLSDMDLFQSVNEIYGSYFSAPYPARECVAVKGLPKGVNVEITVIASLD